MTEQLKDLCFTARRIADLQEEYGRPIAETGKTLRDLANQVERLEAQRKELFSHIRPLITKRMGAEQIREALQRAINKATE